MKFTADWLHEYCRCDVPPAELASMLTMAGAKVESVTRHGEDTVFEVEVTANRPDYLGVIGIARDVALLTNRSMTPPAVGAAGEAVGSLDGVTVTVEDYAACPRYVARVVRDVKVGPSPAWLKRRLESVGLRPVNNIVDITNFVLWETGQPLHAFDLERLGEQRIVVRRARPGETMTAIKDAVTCKLGPAMLVIADGRQPVAVAGVMGGKASEVGESTRHILLESAAFDPACIRRTSRALALASDSSYRFERGVDLNGVEWASRRAAGLILDLAGGTLVSGHIDARIERPEPVRVRLRLPRLYAVLGREIDRVTVKRILDGLGLTCREADGAIECTVPSWRPDVKIETDLIEEVARIYGYERIPSTPRLSLVPVRATTAQRVEALARETLVGLGCYEALTPSFSEPGPAVCVNCWSAADPIAVPDPRGKEPRELRKSLAPALLAVQGRNDAYSEAVTPFFEIARIYLGGGSRETPFSERQVCGIVDPAGFRAVVGRCTALVQRLGIADTLEVEAANWPGFRPDRSVRLRAGGVELGYAAEVTPEAAHSAGLRGTPAVAELDFEVCIARAKIDRTVREVNRLPFVRRDLAVIVDEAVAWSALERTVRAVAPPNLESIEFFDEYRGAPIPAGRKSLAFSLQFRAADRTLTGPEVDGATKSVVDRLVADHGAALRAV